jgi:hypothetical protein
MASLPDANALSASPSAPIINAEQNAAPGQPYWVYSLPASESARAAIQDATRRTLSNPYNSLTADECFGTNPSCFVQDATGSGGTWTIVCNGNQTCLNATWRIALVAPSGATATFAPNPVNGGTASRVTMTLPKTAVVGTSTMTVSWTQVSGASYPPIPNGSTPILVLCSLKDNKCPSLRIQNTIPSPSVYVEGTTTNVAAGWPMQLAMVPTTPPGNSYSYTFSSPSWSIPNSPVTCCSVISGQPAVPLPSPTGSATPVFYWLWP